MRSSSHTMLANMAQQAGQSLYASQSGAQCTEATPDLSALHGILRRIGEVRASLHDIHGIAERACGSLGIAEASPPKAVPNGMLAEIEEALDHLMGLSASAVVRLGRIA